MEYDLYLLQKAFLAKRRDSFTFCIAQKVTKRLVALKTHLFLVPFVWLSGSLARLFVFHFLFLFFAVPYWVLFVHETGPSRCSDNLERQESAYSKWFYFDRQHLFAQLKQFWVTVPAYSRWFFINLILRQQASIKKHCWAMVVRTDARVRHIIKARSVHCHFSRLRRQAETQNCFSAPPFRSQRSADPAL